MTRTAVTQDWFFTPGGSEQVAMELIALLGKPDVFTSFADRNSQFAIGERLHVWPPQRIFGPTRRYRSLVPLYPLWFSMLDLRRFDLVISSSSAFAHAARTAPGAMHLSYIHTPMRFAYELDTYVRGSSLTMPSRIASKLLANPLRRWSRSTAQRPDMLIANSATVAARIKRHWGRDSEVIYPPVAVDAIRPTGEDNGSLLIIARLLRYRRIDLAVAAASRLGRQLVVVGDGPERAALERMAGPSVTFLGHVDRPELIRQIQRCHAYLVPGIEDFGIAPVEAMAAGKPVIGFEEGGVSETVIDGHTGVLFPAQTAQSLVDAIQRLDALKFDSTTIRANAERFSTAVFRGKFIELFQRLGVDPSLYRS